MTSIDTVEWPAPGDIIIDVRHPDEVEKKPLHWPTHRVIVVPFFKLTEQIDTLNKHQSYLLYCERGIMSRLQADAMCKKGFCNIAIFAPPSNPA
tara:strand:- start:536 stop:817 length:282 start_codon:yes stop_codon:yes gene_type:complete